MSEPNKRYYITTPIYYVNGLPHIGTATTTGLADATKRYHLLRGEDAYLLTGTDENARKVTEAAAKAGKDPQAFRAELFETTLSESGSTLRRVHVHAVDSRAAAQYDASDASGNESWTGRFALHLALGVFG